MTEGEKQAQRIESQLRWMRYIVLPGAGLASTLAYIFVIESAGFAAMFFALMLITGTDEYWQRARILHSKVRMSELKAIKNQREAAVYVNGGFRRDLKHFVLIGIAVVVWIYYAG